MTHYEILQVTENATDEVIRMAYKALAKKYHPDVFQGDPQIADDKMKQINTAFEILSDKQKREQYDAFLRNQNHTYQANHQNNSKNQEKADTSPKPKRDFVLPSLKKSGWIIGVLLVLSYIQVWHPYAESGLRDYAYRLGMIDFCLLNILMMIVPIFVVLLKTLSPKGIEKVCITNSIAVYIISLVLYICKLIPAMLIGWLVAIFYFFINKHILLQVTHRMRSKKKALIIVLLILLVLILTIIGCTHTLRKTFGENNSTSNVPPYSGNETENNSTSNTESEKIEYDSYYVGLRTISLSDKQTAQMIVDTWKNGEATEESMIALMNQYGAGQGGGQLYLVQPGDFIEEVDTWCFDRLRKVGDVAIIENVYGYTICYFSSVVER